jgi:ParB-like chromosome segregation protein Spo0J
MQPDDHFQTISSQLIEFSDPFIRLLHDGPVDASLVDNLQRFGQVAPLLVWQHTPERYQLLADYPTFQAIMSLGIENTFCRVLPLSTQPVQR